jgi:hypothetical protein
MKISTIALGAAALLSTTTSLFLYQENASLRAEKGVVAVPLSEEEPPQSCPEAKTVVVTKEVPVSPTPAAPASEPTSGPGERRGFSSTFQEMVERRNKRQERIASFLGRLPGESEEDYKARMSPLVAMGLATPRKLLEEGREIAFDAANVDKEQRASLDSIMSSAYDEALDLANRSITSGELSPYERNPSSMLHLAGSMGAVLDETMDKINKVLTPEQQRQIAESGFDWAEYLAVSAPWETLSAPPPAK